MLSEALGMSYKIEEDGKEDLSWVGDVSSMLRSLGEPKVRLREGIARMVEQRYA
jgi:hypothetical protein